jgi:hypothetical protein
MKTILIYYAASMFASASTLATPQGEEDVEGTVTGLASFADLKSITARIRTSGKNSVMLRDAAMFDGLPEHNVHAVVVLGHPINSAQIAEAYAQVEVQVTDVDDLESLQDGLPEEAKQPAPEELDINALKARATELDINFPQNIGVEKLKAKIADAEEAAAKAAGDSSDDAE